MVWLMPIQIHEHALLLKLCAFLWPSSDHTSHTCHMIRYDGYRSDSEPSRRHGWAIIQFNEYYDASRARHVSSYRMNQAEVIVERTEGWDINKTNKSMKNKQPKHDHFATTLLVVKIVLVKLGVIQVVPARFAPLNRLRADFGQDSSFS